jgi:hypothetical protein
MNKEFNQKVVNIICNISCRCFMPYKTIILSFVTIMDDRVEVPELCLTEQEWVNIIVKSPYFG